MSGAIEFACPYCERVTRVPSTFAGKQGKCPGCQRVIEVPNPAEAEVQDGVPTMPTPSPVVDSMGISGAVAGGAPTATAGDPVAGPGVANTSVSGPVAGLTPPPIPDWQKQNLKAGARPDSDDGGADDGALRPCPFCGEQIKAVAKKCKFCGEFLDKRLRDNRGGGGGARGGGVLASRGTRFVAKFVDGLLEVPGYMLMGVGWAIASDGRNKEPVGIAMLGLGFLVVLGVTVYQWYLLSTRGQTLAKGWFGIRIVKIDGSPLDFVHAVILRNWVYAMIGFIPGGIGGCVQLLGYLAIFTEDQRCLHDHIASTRVIEAGSERRDAG